MDCIAYQAPPPMGFSKQEYWSGSPFPSPTHSPEVLLYDSRDGNVTTMLSSALRVKYMKPNHPGILAWVSSSQRQIWLSEQVTTQRPVSCHCSQTVSEHHLTVLGWILLPTGYPTTSCLGGEPKQIFTDIQYPCSASTVSILKILILSPPVAIRILFQHFQD